MIGGKSLEEAHSLCAPDIVEFPQEGSNGLAKNMHDCIGITIGSVRDVLAELGFAQSDSIPVSYRIHRR